MLYLVVIAFFKKVIIRRGWKEDCNSGYVIVVIILLTISGCGICFVKILYDDLVMLFSALFQNSCKYPAYGDVVHKIISF
jgi:hypothetical protein